MMRNSDPRQREAKVAGALIILNAAPRISSARFTFAVMERAMVISRSLRGPAKSHARVCVCISASYRVDDSRQLAARSKHVEET